MPHKVQMNRGEQPSKGSAVVKRAFSITAIAWALAAVCPRMADAQRISEARAIAENSESVEAAAPCALPSDPHGIPAALDSAITGPADKDRACMTALLTPDARISLISVNADGGANRKVLSLDDWIARTRARGHILLEEKQLNFRVDRFADIANLWSLYTLHSDGHAVARGINSIQAIKESGGWRITGILVQAESAAAPLPEGYLP